LLLCLKHDPGRVFVIVSYSERKQFRADRNPIRWKQLSKKATTKAGTVRLESEVEGSAPIVLLPFLIQESLDGILQLSGNVSGECRKK